MHWLANCYLCWASGTSGVWVATINSSPTLVLRLEVLALSTEIREAISPKLCFSRLLPALSHRFFCSLPIAGHGLCCSKAVWVGAGLEDQCVCSVWARHTAVLSAACRSSWADVAKWGPKKVDYGNIIMWGKFLYLELLLGSSVSHLALSFICLLDCCTYLIAMHWPLSLLPPDFPS